MIDVKIRYSKGEVKYFKENMNLFLRKFIFSLFTECLSLRIFSLVAIGTAAIRIWFGATPTRNGAVARPIHLLYTGTGQHILKVEARSEDNLAAINRACLHIFQLVLALGVDAGTETAELTQLYRKIPC